MWPWSKRKLTHTPEKISDAVQEKLFALAAQRNALEDELLRMTNRYEVINAEKNRLKKRVDDMTEYVRSWLLVEKDEPNEQKEPEVLRFDEDTSNIYHF